MFQLTWQYPDSMPLSKVEWLSRILQDNYGIQTSPEKGSTDSHTLRCADITGSIVLKHITDFTRSDNWWTPNGIKPEVPLVAPSLPIIKGVAFSNGDYENWTSDSSVELGIDFFETMFSVLSREEERDSSELDAHMRFPAHASDAQQRAYLDRPIIDEYMEILWAYIKRIWPDAKRSKRKGTIRYSCDVDVPFDPAASGPIEFIKRFAADLIIRTNPGMALKRCRNCWNASRGNITQDPDYQFPFILEQLKSLNSPAVFYFLSTPKTGKGQGWYKINDPKILQLLKLLHDEGHRIGLHGSFGTYASSSQYQREIDLLRDSCTSIGIDAPIIQNRQHYLQFDIHETPDILEDSGIERDSSGAYADAAGFRFGTAIPFPMWSWRKNEGMKLIQEPLICMEASLLAPKYMNLPHYPDAYEYASRLKQRALAYGGDFTLLWHNSHLKTEADKSLLSDLLQPIA